jgi:hypothetical protein
MIPASSCIELANMGSVSTYIHHQIAVMVTTSVDVYHVNRHSSNLKMIVLNERTEEVRSGIHFYGQKVPPVGFEVLTAVVMKRAIFWDITPCSPLSTDFSEKHIASICRVEE